MTTTRLTSRLSSFERGKDIKLCEDAKIILKRVDEAIDLLNSGNYGTCEHCGNDIEEDRLDLIPYTRLCSRCQGDVHTTAPPKRDRPIEERGAWNPIWKWYTRQEDSGHRRRRRVARSGEVWVSKRASRSGRRPRQSGSLRRRWESDERSS